MIAWAHGTAGGAADACVVSADDGPDYPGHDYTSLMDLSLDQWVKRGFVVVQPDYEGFGPPGPNPYDIGESQARSVIDSVRAARNLDARVGDRWVSTGHSLGGHSALFTAALAHQRAPELVLVGTVSMAPVSTFADRLRTLAANPLAQLVDQNFALEVFGAATASPDVKPERFLIPSALALYDRVDQDCAATIRDAWAFKRSRDILQPGADLQPLLTVFDANEPAGLHLGSLPVLVVQGGVDFSVFPFLTDAVVQSLRDNGATQLTYLTYPNDDHNGVVESSLPDVEHWVDARVAEHPVTTTTTSTTTSTTSTTITPPTSTGISVLAVTATSPTTTPATTPATGTLPATGISENALWVEAIVALVLLRVGYFCVSLTKPPRPRRRSAPGRGHEAG